jgi:hypothetical protein
MEKDPAKGTSPAVDFTREEAAAEKDQPSWHLARRPTSPPSPLLPRPPADPAKINTLIQDDR